MANTICMILDTDGFVVNRTFYARELALIPLTEDTEARRFGFDLECFLKPTVKERMTIRWLTRNLHGLPFNAAPGEIVFAAEEYDEIILHYYEKYRTWDRNVVGYKSDSKKSTLVSLGIPCINLEMYGCPKFDDLPPSVDCQYHFGGVKGHCPLAKVKVLKQWLNNWNGECGKC